MPAPASGRWLCSTSPSTAAPRRWRCARAGGLTPCWAGCMPTTRAAPMRSPSVVRAAAVPCLPTAQSRPRRDDPRGPAHGRGATARRGRPRAALDVAPPRWLGARPVRAEVLSGDDPHSPAPPHAVVEASCRGSKLSWKQAVVEASCRGSKPRRCSAGPTPSGGRPLSSKSFVEQVQGVLDGAQRDRHLLVYVDEAHIPQDADLGYGWAERGECFWVASSSPGLSARVSVYGLYLYNEGQVRLWPYTRANGEHTIEVLQRLRAEVPERPLIVLWDGAPDHRAKIVREAATALNITLMPLPSYSPDLMPVEALWRWLREDVTC